MTRLFKEFFDSEKAGGFVLLFCAVLSLIIANVPLGGEYIHFWHAAVAGHPVEYWINDGLMTIFFLLIGLELEREIYIGELSSFSKASLPAFAALGGMLFPAGIHLMLNYGMPSQNGAGIPMATDIAFAIGILSLLGSRVPLSLKVFLTALAVIDDLGAILTIAVFYTKEISFIYLAAALIVFGLLLLLNRFKVHRGWPYLIGGVLMWYCMLQSGVHATITGVLLAFAYPFAYGSEKSPSFVLQHVLHKPVALLILPVFALANTAIAIPTDWLAGLTAKNSLGIILGLVLGKPLGILAFCSIAVMFGVSKLPTGLTWKHILGAGFLAGIGFTMSIFITLLAFDTAALIVQSKIAIMAASLMGAVIGLVFLNRALPKAKKQAAKSEARTDLLD